MFVEVKWILFVSEPVQVSVQSPNIRLSYPIFSV